MPPRQVSRVVDVHRAGGRGVDEAFEGGRQVDRGAGLGQRPVGLAPQGPAGGAVVGVRRPVGVGAAQDMAQIGGRARTGELRAN